MVILSTALAGALSVPAFPPCEAPGPQLVLLSKVNDLAFDAEGALWVADAGSLTRRDDSLAILASHEPGAHGWDRLQVAESSMFATNKLGATWWSDGKPRPRPAPGGHGRSKELVVTAGWIETPAGKRIVELPLLPTTPFWTSAQRAEAGQLLGYAKELPAGVVSAARRESDGAIAVATWERLLLYNGDGELLAERPLVPWTDQIGWYAERLFTVRLGELRFFGPDEQSVRIEGTWSSARVFGGELLATDLQGALWRIRPDGKQDRLGCLFDHCEEVRLPMPAPPTADSAEAVGAALLAHHRDLEAWFEATAPRPTLLGERDGSLIVGILDPLSFEVVGRRIIERVLTLDQRFREVDSESVDPGDEAILGLFDPASPSSDGPRLRQTAEHFLVERGGEVVVGLPPRWTMQVRGRTASVGVGERIVVGPAGRDAHWAPTEVWCTPRPGGEAATDTPGALARRKPGDPVRSSPFELRHRDVGHRYPDVGHRYRQHTEGRVIFGGIDEPLDTLTGVSPSKELVLVDHGVVAWKGTRAAWTAALESPVVPPESPADRAAWLTAHPPKTKTTEEREEAQRAELRELRGASESGGPPDRFQGESFADHFRWPGPPPEGPALVWSDRHLETGWKLADTLGLPLYQQSNNHPGLPVVTGDVQLPPFLVVDGRIHTVWLFPPTVETLQELLASLGR